MRPSEFEAIRPHLQEALQNIDADLNRRQSLEDDRELHELFNRLAALPEDTPSKVKLQELPPKEKKRVLRTMLGPPPKNKRAMQTYRVMEKRLERSPPITSPDMACLYPWGASAREAVVWLRKGDWTTEANEIDLVLHRLPTGPVDGRHPEYLDRHFDAIRATAERVKTILTAVLDDSKDKGGKSDDASAARPKADQDGSADAPNETKRRGRLPKADSDAKRADMLATLRQHPSLKDDVGKLASMVGVGKSTVRRWLNKEQQKYLESKAARPEPAEE